MRLIDVDALLAELDKFANPMPNKSGYDFLCGMATATTEIENAPTVDAVVLPCKPGDTVYQTDQIRIYPLTIKKLIYDAGHIDFDESAIGKSIFLTREEAEAALAKMG